MERLFLFTVVIGWMLTSGCSSAPRLALDEDLKPSAKEIIVTEKPDISGNGKVTFGDYKITKIKFGPKTGMSASAGSIASGSKSNAKFELTWQPKGKKKTKIKCNRASKSSKVKFAGSSESAEWTCKAKKFTLKTTQAGKGGPGDMLGLSKMPEHSGTAKVGGTKIKIASSNRGADGSTAKVRTGYNFSVKGKVVAAADLSGEWSFWYSSKLKKKMRRKVAMVAAVMFTEFKLVP